MDFQTSSSFLKEDARSMSKRKVLKVRKRHDPSQEGEKHNGAWGVVRGFASAESHVEEEQQPHCRANIHPTRFHARKLSLLTSVKQSQNLLRISTPSSP